MHNPIGEPTTSLVDLATVGVRSVEPMTNSGSSSSSGFAEIALVGRAIRSDRRIIGCWGVDVVWNGIRVGPTASG